MTPRYRPGSAYLWACDCWRRALWKYILFHDLFVVDSLIYLFLYLCIEVLSLANAFFRRSRLSFALDVVLAADASQLLVFCIGCTASNFCYLFIFLSYFICVYLTFLSPLGSCFALLSLGSRFCLSCCSWLWTVYFGWKRTYGEGICVKIVYIATR